MTSSNLKIDEEYTPKLDGVYGNYIGNIPFDNLKESVKFFLNSKGHRCKELEEINTTDFILFTGCSHTAGFGLEIEDTYPFLVSNLLNKSYYNLGVGGSGIDVLFHNLAIFFTSNLPKPKALIVQKPSSTRYVRLGKTYTRSDLVFEGSWSNNKLIDFAMLGEDIGFFDMRILMLKKFINNLNIPLITINLPVYKKEFYSNSIQFEPIDYALDNIHYGPRSHKKLAEEIVLYSFKNGSEF